MKRSVPSCSELPNPSLKPILTTLVSKHVFDASLHFRTLILKSNAAHLSCCVFEQAEKNVYLEERLQVLQQQNEDLKIRIDKNVAVSRSDEFPDLALIKNYLGWALVI